MKTFIAPTALAAATWCSACAGTEFSPDPSASSGASAVEAPRWRGYFEASDEEDLAAHRGAQTVVPEYAPSEGVIVSHHLLDRADRWPFGAALLEQGILWVYLPTRNDAHNDRLLDGFYDHLVAERGEAGRRLYRNLHTFSATGVAIDQQSSWARGIWARDWGPQPARDTAGRLQLLDFNYKWGRDYEDAAPRAYTDRRNRDVDDVARHRRLSLPFRLDGGNFMADRRGNCFVTDGSGATPAHDEFRAYLRDYAGCAHTVIFPEMPHEKTKHLDLWGKLLSDDTVAIAGLEPGQEALVPPEFVSVFAEIRAFLEARAAEFAQLGYRVVRLPTPAPAFKYDGRLVARSYVNSLIVSDGGGRRRIYVPSYRRPLYPLYRDAADYADAQALPGLEDKVRALLEAEGFEVVFVPSDDLIYQGGAVHCVTMQIASGLD